MFTRMSRASLLRAFPNLGVPVATAALLIFLPGMVAAQAKIADVTLEVPDFTTGFGQSLAGLGDVNGDGRGDWVASYNELLDIEVSIGWVQVRSGADHSVLWQWEGDSISDGFGTCVDAAGDVDGDGIDDVVVGAPKDAAGGFEAGLVRVLSTATGAVLHDIHGTRQGAIGSAAPSPESATWTAMVGVTSPRPRRRRPARASSRSTPEPRPRSWRASTALRASAPSGATRVPAGDFNADGVPDVAIMSGDLFVAPMELRVCSGAWIASRAGPEVLFDMVDPAFSRFSVDAAGDVDHDGYDDVVVGRPRAPEFGPYVGGVRVISGKDHGVLLEVTGTVPNVALGSSVAGASDLDGDGDPDVLAFAPVLGFAPTAHVLAISGHDGSVLYDCSVFQPPFFVFGTMFGLDGLGDVNGDGFSDWAVEQPDMKTVSLYSPAGLWDDLGHALPGTFGAPQLAGTGLLLGGDAMSIALAGALPSHPVALAIGLNAVNLPFRGGTFVPDADFVLFTTSDASGGLLLQDTWPVDVPAQSFYFQVWLTDPAGVEGFAASNGLRGQSPLRPSIARHANAARADLPRRRA